MSKIPLLFILLPIAEIYLLMRIGERFGGWTVVAMLIGSGLLGAVIARFEGLRVIQACRDALAKGTLPTDGVVNGALVLLGCMLLIIPGVLTDMLALVLLLPFTRQLVARVAMARAARAIERGTLHVAQSQPRPGGSAERQSVIDVQGETVEEVQAPSSESPVRQLKP